MLLSSDVRRVLVCAPSNAAVDEIVTRLSTGGLIGLKSDKKLGAHLLRVGAMDYDPSEDVLSHTLDMICKVNKISKEKTVRHAKIVCCTLCASGQNMMELIKDSVDYLIIDEACQAVEPAALIPLELNPGRVILVGD